MGDIMRRFLAPLFAGLLLFVPLLSDRSLADLKVVGETTVIVTKLPFDITCDTQASLYIWKLPAGWEGTESKGKITLTKASGKGTVSVQTWKTVVDFDKKEQKEVTTFEKVEVTVGVPLPPPTPVDPTPNPTPTPSPTTAPIGLPGYAALIIEDSSERAKLPPSQLSVLFGKQVRDYLNSKCQADPTVATWKAWRIYDKDIDLKSENKVWQDAIKRPRTSLPWLIVSNGKTGFEGPLPKTETETINLLNTYLPK